MTNIYKEILQKYSKVKCQLFVSPLRKRFSGKEKYVLEPWWQHKLHIKQTEALNIFWASL